MLSETTLPSEGILLRNHPPELRRGRRHGDQSEPGERADHLPLRNGLRSLVSPAVAPALGLILLPLSFLSLCLHVQSRRYPKRPPLFRGSHFWFIVDTSYLIFSPPFKLVLGTDSFSSGGVRLIIRTLKMTTQIGRDHLSHAKMNKWLGQCHWKTNTYPVTAKSDGKNYDHYVFQISPYSQHLNAVSPALAPHNPIHNVTSARGGGLQSLT